MEAAALPESFRVRMTRYVPSEPTPPQAAFLVVPQREALYGGAAGGGKSEALLMAALQYADVPGYAGLLMRRTYTELRMPGGLLHRAMEWLSPTDASWNGEEHSWTFPSGASLTFGHAEYEESVYRYQSAEFQFVGFDELGTFTEAQYRFMRSRARRPEGFPVPIRLRAASNPGSVWVRDYFLPRLDEYGNKRFPRDPESGELRVFIPARLDDNPFLDRADYATTLEGLDPVMRRRLLDGDWNVTAAGGFFRRDRWTIEDRLPLERYRFSRPVRRWDLAATPKTPTNDPDWTAGAKSRLEEYELRDGAWKRLVDERGRASGRTWIEDIVRTRARPQEVEELIQATAELDGPETFVDIEQEPGSSGIAVVDYYKRRLRGYTVRGIRTDKKKEVRAGPFASQAEAGGIVLVRGLWNAPFVEEAEAFDGSGKTHDDMLDAAIGSWEAHTRNVGNVFSW